LELFYDLNLQQSISNPVSAANIIDGLFLQNIILHQIQKTNWMLVFTATLNSME